MNYVTRRIGTHRVAQTLVSLTMVMFGRVATAQTPHVSANTGYVVPSPRLFLLYWDDDWNKHNPVRRGEIKTFVNSLITNGYLNWASAPASNAHRVRTLRSLAEADRSQAPYYHHCGRGRRSSESSFR